MNYTDFIQNKTKTFIDAGFSAGSLNPFLFDFQEHIVRTALMKGRYAIFADCGLGKTLMQLAWAYEVMMHTNAPVLILAPLAVAGQTIGEGKKFGVEVVKVEEVDFNSCLSCICITNYEQLEKVDCSFFAGIVLDESSILKNFEGATRNLIIESFKATPYKLACTATPSPNDPMELGNHSEFLGIMSRVEMLAMYFVHDGGETAKWRIKGHAYSIFWQWVSTWSVMLSKPSDIGYSAKGYDLPELNMVEKTVKVPKRDNGQLFNDISINATNFNFELRLTQLNRMDEVAKIVNNSDDNFIIWIKQNEEGDRLMEMIPDAIEVRGTDTPERKEKYLLGFARGEFRVLITKTKIAQFGLNYQNCHNQVFASLDFSFEGLYQAIRRSYRFGQLHPVNIFLVTTDTMKNVIASIWQKEKQFQQMQAEMTKAINSHLSTKVIPLPMESTQVITDRYTLKRGDCVELIKTVPSDSVHFSIFSPPFAQLYTYSDHIEDMGNSRSHDEFMVHFGFLAKELQRVMMPGRNIAIHCMDLPIQKGKEGFIGLRDFSGMIVDLFSENGFIYHDRITIWKDPVVEMQRTKALGLLHKQVKKDSSMSRTGIPDYLLVFRKEGVNSEPITNTGIPVDLWQKYASPVWMDINYSDTLQFRTAKDGNDEKHICPLQLPTIERAIHLWSNPGDTVLTPFGGIGSEAYQALKMNRKAIAFELKESYYEVAARNLSNVVLSTNQQLLFA